MFRRTQDPGLAGLDFVYGAITLFRTAFQLFLLSEPVRFAGPTTPKSKLFGLGFSLFARRY